MRRRWAAALLAAFLVTDWVATPVASAAVTQGAGHSSFAADACTDSSGVTVVVDFAELGGGVIVACASGLTARSRGSDALAAAGISWSPPANQPGFVCRLAGRPSADEVFGTTGQDDYRESCVDTPPADAHWSYWQSSGDGSWAYSDGGVTSSRVKPGGFEGWSFSTGALLPPDYNPVGGEAEPMPQPEPEPVPMPQPEPEPESQPQREQSAAAAPVPQAPAAPEPEPEPEPAQTTAAASPETTAVESRTVADSASAAASTASNPATTSSVSASPRSSGPSTSTSVAVTALADPASDVDSGGGGWVLGGLALIAALAAAAFVVVRHRRHG